MVGCIPVEPKLVFPDSGILFNSSSEYHLNVLSKFMILCKLANYIIKLFSIFICKIKQ